MSLEWLCDRHDHRVTAALEHQCPVCKAEPGNDCRPPIGPGKIVHEARVPDKVLFNDHLPPEKVRG